jgi:hypothetical protein
MRTLVILPFLFVCSLLIGKSNEIIGKPIKIGKLEIAQNDFTERMTWLDAKKACASLGKGWRLPTKDELSLLYTNKDKIGGFVNAWYWSSTEHYISGTAWLVGFSNEIKFDYKDKMGFYNGVRVRAVRTVN